MSGALTVVTPPVEEPISADELATHLRITDPAESDLLNSYVGAVRRHIEEIAGLAFLTQTLEWALDAFPSPWPSVPGFPTTFGSFPVTYERFGGMELPRPPLVSVTSVTYVDPAGATQTLSPTLYQVDTRGIPGRVVPAYGKTWPSTRWQPNCVVVQYVAGSSLADLERSRPDLLHTLRVAAGMLYEFREELVDGNAPQATGLLERLLAPHRVWVTA